MLTQVQVLSHILGAKMCSSDNQAYFATFALCLISRL